MIIISIKKKTFDYFLGHKLNSMHGSQLAFQDRNLKRNNRRQSRQPCMVLAPSKEEGQRLREVK